MVKLVDLLGGGESQVKPFGEGQVGLARTHDVNGIAGLRSKDRSRL